MEKYFLEKDIKVFYVTANSFPEGVQDAHKELYSKLASTENRNFFGISHPDRDGKIIYKAAVEALEGEEEKTGMKTFVIKSGIYISEFIPDFCKDVRSIEKAFKELLASPDIDPQGYCLEIYEGLNEVRCMVPLVLND